MMSGSHTKNKNKMFRFVVWLGGTTSQHSSNTKNARVSQKSKTGLTKESKFLLAQITNVMQICANAQAHYL